MRRILLVTPLYSPDVGGPATHALFVEQNLVRLDCKLQIIKFGHFLKYPYIIRHVVFFFKVLKQAKNVDTVYALDPLGVGLPAGLAARILGKRFVLRVAGDRAWETGVQEFGVKDTLDDFARNQYHSLPIFIIKSGQKLTASLAHTIIVPSEYLKMIVTSWGVESKKINVVHSAYEPQDLPSKETLRQELGVRGFSIVSAGRLVPWKGFKALIELWPEVMAFRGDATLTIVGDGPDREMLEQLVRLLRLDDVVTFTGNVSHADVLQRVRAADLFVLDTGYEGLSHQLLEVMDMGTAIITTRIGGNPELIEDGKDGILVEYNNRTQLLTAMREIIENPIRARLLTQNAHEKLKQFNPAVIAKQLNALL
ncbi:MAG TPA: glycosyltransferase family 4 protein [Candidatus Paceibacterota bacterium]